MYKIENCFEIDLPKIRSYSYTDDSESANAAKIAARLSDEGSAISLCISDLKIAETA